MSDGIILRDEVRSSQPAGEQLMRGLIFIRANTMNMIRLQLAMERGDRRLALQTIDELVELDSKIRDLVEAEAAGAEISEMQREADQQRLTLSLEKLALAAGVRSRGPDRTWSRPVCRGPVTDFSSGRFAAIDAVAIDADVTDPVVIDHAQGSANRVTEAAADASKPRPLRMLGVAVLLIVLCAMIVGAIIQRAAGPLVADLLSKGYASWPM